jgi:K+-sensing histidine kinase KdpD
MTVEPRPTPQHLDELVRECLMDAQRDLAERSLAVTRQMATDIPALPLDPDLMREALGILVGEVIRHAAPATRVRVTVKAGRNAQMVALKSAGAGLTDVQREMLFTGEARPGTLARARSIVDAHGGVLWANGKPGRGMTYYLTLPPRAAGAA